MTSATAPTTARCSGGCCSACSSSSVGSTRPSCCTPRTASPTAPASAASTWAASGRRPPSASCPKVWEAGLPSRSPSVPLVIGPCSAPATAGLTVDVASTAARRRQPGCAHSTWDPRQVWDYYSGADQQQAVVAIDQTRLDQAIESFAAQVDQPAVQGAVTFDDGQINARYPRKGTILDRAGAAAAIRSAFLHGTGPNQVVSAADPDRRAPAVQGGGQPRDGRLRQPGDVGRGGGQARRVRRAARARGLLRRVVDAGPGRRAASPARRQGPGQAAAAPHAEDRPGTPQRPPRRPRRPGPRRTVQGRPDLP